MFLIHSARDSIFPIYFYNEAFWNVCWILYGLIKDLISYMLAEILYSQ